MSLIFIGQQTVRYQTLESSQTVLQAPQISDAILFITTEAVFNMFIITAVTDENANIGSGYLRKCESLLIAQKRIEILMAAHGSINPNFPYTNCELDGSYGAVQMEGNQYVNELKFQ
jgi:hypothetical protein